VKRFREVPWILWLALLPTLLLSCRGGSHSEPHSSAATPATPANLNRFDDFLKTDMVPADGFDFAVGDKHLSFGCVVMHLYDISKLYDEIDAGTMVVIF
jgi:hypothetical protein